MRGGTVPSSPLREVTPGPGAVARASPKSPREAKLTSGVSSKFIKLIKHGEILCFRGGFQWFSRGKYGELIQLIGGFFHGHRRVFQGVPSSRRVSARQAAVQVSRPWYAGSMCGGWRKRQCIDIWPSGITFMPPLLHFFVQKCLNIANDEVMQSCTHTHQQTHRVQLNMPTSGENTEIDIPDLKALCTCCKVHPERPQCITL